MVCLFFCRMSSSTEESSMILPSHPKLPKGKTLAVIVLDGWGEQIADQYNAIHVANTPTMDALKKVLSLCIRHIHKSQCALFHSLSSMSLLVGLCIIISLCQLFFFLYLRRNP